MLCTRNPTDAIKCTKRQTKCANAETLSKLTDAGHERGQVVAKYIFIVL